MIKKNWGIINGVLAILIVFLFLTPNSSALTWTKGSDMGYTFQGATGKFDEGFVASPSPVWEGSKLNLWYMGRTSSGDWRIGFASTTNPLKGDWTRENGGDAVFSKGSSGKFDDEATMYPMVVKKAGTYHMWYTGYSGTEFAIGYAQSSDGISWTRQNSGNAVLSKTGAGWEDYNIMTSFVMWDGTSKWMMWYGGCTSSTTCDIGYADSTDGISWSRYASNPVISHGGTYDSTYALHPWVLKIGIYYEMWYQGYDGTKAITVHTDSQNGLTSWSAKEVFINIGADGEYDDQHACHASVYTTITDELRYLYAGYDGSNYRIMYGMSYTPNPDYFYKFSVNGPVVLEVSESGHFDTKDVRDPAVIYDDTASKYKMWYTGHISGETTKRIGYAISSNPDSGWTREAPNLMGGHYESLQVGSSGAWDDAAVTEPSLVHDETAGTYQMWYVGNDGSDNAFGYATSNDGKSWTKSGSNPILQKGGSGAWDETGIYSPTVVRVDSTHYKLWYVGKDSNGVYKIGYATSSDGVSWTKYGSNPLISPTADSIDADGVLYPSVFLYTGDGYYYMSYTCRQVVSSSERLKVCEATSSDGISWTKKTSGGVPTPTINIGSAGDFDAEGTASSTIWYQGGWKIWYSGADRDYRNGDAYGWHWRIGYATGAA